MLKIKQAANGHYYFTLSSKNGKVLVTSETYASKRNVYRAVARFQQEAPILCKRVVNEID